MKALSLLMLLVCFVQQEKHSYYWSELVVSVMGRSSFEQRGSPDLMPFKAFVEIKDDTSKSGYLFVKVNFLNFSDTNSTFSLGTLKMLQRSLENEKYRDIYEYQYDSYQIENRNHTTKWIKVEPDGGIIITQLSKCGLSKEYGIFFLDS